MVGAPPVVRLMTQFERCLMIFRNGAKASGRLVGLAGLRVARVQMYDRRARLGGTDRGIGDFLGRHRQVPATSKACGSRPSRRR